MRIAYLTTDEVNQALAAQMAAECGAVISARLPNDPPPDGLFDAVLYNLDDVPRDERSAVLEGFCRGKPAHPTAVHGYDITEEQAKTLDPKRRGGCATPSSRPAPQSVYRRSAKPRDCPAGRRRDGSYLSQPGQVAVESKPPIPPFDLPAIRRKRLQTGGEGTPLLS